MVKFQVTYDIVTEESARDGDTAESGFMLPGNWHIDIDTALADTAGEYGMSLRKALNLVCPQENAGYWFTELNERIDYRTGDRETRAPHPPKGITVASYARLCRLFGLREARV